MNEAQIRDRLQQAVGDARYPAYLSSRVEASLERPARDQARRSLPLRSQTPWLAGIGRAGSLAAALLVVLLIAVFVVGVHAWRSADVNTRPQPSGQNPAIKSYQTMIDADFQRWADTHPIGCLGVSDADCPANTAVVIAAVQRWVDDVNATEPPARFTYIAPQMSRHLARDISYLNATVDAYMAKDENGMNATAAAARIEFNAAVREKEDMVASSQGTIGLYTAQVRLDRAYLVACSLCRHLVGQTQLTCPASQVPSCADEIAAVRLQVEIFQGDLVRNFAPGSLAAKDGRLGADLFAAYVALNSMESALSAGDQVGLQAGHVALRQALDRVESDAATITNSN